MTTTTPPVMRTTTVAAPVPDAFALFTEHIAMWWPRESHSVFGDDSASIRFEDGQLVERATDGRADVWGSVLAWNPPHSLTFTWHPGRPVAEETEVTVTFHPEGAGTRVDLVHRGWERLVDGAARRSGYADDGGWTLVLAALHGCGSPRIPRASTTEHR